MKIRLSSSKNEEIGHFISEVGSPLNQKTVHDDLQTLWDMNSFDDIRAEVVNTPDGKVDLIYVVKEKPWVGRVKFEGNKELKTEDLEKEIDVKTGVPYQAKEIKEKAERIKQMYREQRYPIAEANAEVTPGKDNTVNITFKIQEHAKIQLRQMRFTGNRVFSDEKIHEALKYVREDYRWSDFVDMLRGRSPSGIFDESALERDLFENLRTFYLNNGYAEVKFGKPYLWISPDKRFGYVTLPIEAGDLYKLGSFDIQFDGPSPFSKEKLLPKEVWETINKKVGETYNRELFNKPFEKIMLTYKNNGYAFATVSEKAESDPVTKKVAFSFMIKPGKKVYIGKIQIMGNNKTRDRVIRRELKIAEGDLYHQEYINESEKLLQRLAFFQSVKITVKNSQNFDDRVDLIIEVAEMPTGMINFGLGFSTVQYLILQAQLQQRNFFGYGGTLELYAMVAPFGELKYQTYNLRYIDPRFLDTRFTFSASLYRSLQYFPNATFLKTIMGGSIGFGYLFTDTLQLNLSYKLDWNDVSALGPDLRGTSLAPLLYRTAFTSAVRLDFTYNNVNDNAIPERGLTRPLGMRHTLNLELADQYLGSQINYFKMEGALRFYRPIWGPFNFRFIVGAGFIVSRKQAGKPEGVPISERFYNFQGVPFENRGFPIYSLGPRFALAGQDPLAGPQYISVGANYYLRATAELEFKLLPEKYNMFDFRGVVFLDVGNGYNTEDSYCREGDGAPGVFSPCQKYPTLQNLRYSAGFGIRWMRSPLGAPLRFEFGFPLNRVLDQGFKEQPFFFTFGMGTSF